MEKGRSTMQTRIRISVPTVALCLSLALAGCAAWKKSHEETVPAAPAAAAPAAPVSGTVGEGLVSATATVKAIDLKTRQVTLQRADGSTFKFRAGEEVRNLPQVKVGDEVTVTYYEALAYEVKKPGEATPGAAVGEGVERAKLGEKPAAAGVRVVTVTATIDAIDKAAGTVTLRTADGETTTIKAREPEKLERVAVGDLVEITYTEGVAISVQAPQK
jgi:Cu/Ag efflux protein CusF